jgi:outer membrane lipoprotein-sorting protein
MGRSSWVSLLALIATALVAAPAAPASAAAVEAAPLSAADQADLHRIEAYLDAMHTLKADFQQSNPDGSISTGDFYLARPGRMRFEYAPPQHLVIVSDGNYVAINDQDEHQLTFYPVGLTPAWFLLREGIKLSGDVTVTRFERDPGALRVTAVQTRHPDAGSITMVFSDHPLQLIKWTVVDPQQNSTTVAILNPQEGVSLDNKLFILPNRYSVQQRN